MKTKIFKRITAAMLAAVMAVIATVSSFANETNKEKGVIIEDSSGWFDISLVKPIDIKDFNLSEDCFDYTEQSHVMPRAGTSLNIHHYYQDGQSYSDVYLGTWSELSDRYTIGNSGCLVTCVAMYHRYLENSAINPRGVDTSLKVAGLDTSDLSLDGVANAYGWTTQCKVYKTITSSSTALSKIKTEVNNSRPVIVGLAKFDSNNVLTSTHFVLAYGYNDSIVYIHDPLSTNNYTALSQYTNTGWKVYNLRSYSN